MPETCFVCQQNCSRKVCFECSCYAHPKCWQKYQIKLSPRTCPVCKTENIVKPYNTRSKSFYDKEIVASLMKELSLKFDPRSYLIEKIQFLISEVFAVCPANKELKIEKISKIMYWLLAGSKFSDSTNLLTHDKLVEVISKRLIAFKRDGWSVARQWHRLLLGSNI